MSDSKKGETKTLEGTEVAQYDGPVLEVERVWKDVKVNGKEMAVIIDYDPHSSKGKMLEEIMQILGQSEFSSVDDAWNEVLSVRQSFLGRWDIEFELSDNNESDLLRVKGVERTTGDYDKDLMHGIIEGLQKEKDSWVKESLTELEKENLLVDFSPEEKEDYAKGLRRCWDYAQGFVALMRLSSSIELFKEADQHLKSAEEKLQRLSGPEGLVEARHFAAKEKQLLDTAKTSGETFDAEILSKLEAVNKRIEKEEQKNAAREAVKQKLAEINNHISGKFEDVDIAQAMIECNEIEKRIEEYVSLTDDDDTVAAQMKEDLMLIRGSISEINKKLAGEEVRKEVEAAFEEAKKAISGEPEGVDVGQAESLCGEVEKKVNEYVRLAGSNDTAVAEMMGDLNLIKRGIAEVQEQQDRLKIESEFREAKEKVEKIEHARKKAEEYITEVKAATGKDPGMIDIKKTEGLFEQAKNEVGEYEQLAGGNSAAAKKMIQDLRLAELKIEGAKESQGRSEIVREHNSWFVNIEREHAEVIAKATAEKKEKEKQAEIDRKRLRKQLFQSTYGNNAGTEDPLATLIPTEIGGAPSESATGVNTEPAKVETHPPVATRRPPRAFRTPKMNQPQGFNLSAEDANLLALLVHKGMIDSPQEETKLKLDVSKGFPERLKEKVIHLIGDINKNSSPTDINALLTCARDFARKNAAYFDKNYEKILGFTASKDDRKDALDFLQSMQGPRPGFFSGSQSSKPVGMLAPLGPTAASPDIPTSERLDGKKKELELLVKSAAPPAKERRRPRKQPTPPPDKPPTPPPDGSASKRRNRLV